jgi:hypothetical protein
MKSRGLFPGPRSVPKRSGYGGSAGNSEYKHVLPDTDGFQEGMTGWKSGRTGGGISGRNRLAGRPLFQDKSLSGEGGLAYDASLSSVLGDKGKPDKGGEPDIAAAKKG